MAGQADPIDRGRETLLRRTARGGRAVRGHRRRGAPESRTALRDEDIDVTPDRAQQNLARLADVLNRLECSLEVDPAHPEKAVSLPPDYFTASVLAQTTVWNLQARRLGLAPARRWESQSTSQQVSVAIIVRGGAPCPYAGASSQSLATLGSGEPSIRRPSLTRTTGSLRAAQNLRARISEAERASQGRPVRAERSEPRSGALYGPAQRSYIEHPLNVRRTPSRPGC
jgi:hypothetical protein